MAGAGATAAGTGLSSSPEPSATAVATAHEEEEDASVSTSMDGDEAIDTNGGRARRTIRKPNAAAVLARVPLSCKIEPVEGMEGGGT